MTFEELKGYNTVAIKCGASDDEDFDEVIDITEEKVPKKRVTYLDKILDYSMKYKFPFRKLKWKNRVDRIDDITARIIACCLDREEVKKNGMKYITGNEDFAHEVLNIVNGIKDRLDVKLKVDMKAIDEPRPCELNDDDDIVLPMDEESFNIAYTILGESTGRGYERIRKKFNEINIDKPLPSMYFLNKKLPIKIEAIEFDSNSSELDMTADKDKLLYGLATGKDVKSEEEALMLFSQKDQLEKTIGAKLYGNLDNYVDLMRKKHEDKGVSIQDGEDVILLSSFDGAEAIRTNTKVSTVISYSSSMLTSSMITSKQVKAGSSFNICTWMQVLGKEDFTTLNGSLSNYFQSRQEYTSGTKKIQHLPNSKVYCYDVHDGKMMYMLFQHSVWNRKHHPFIMCKCKRFEGVNENESHVCNLWSDEDYKKSWEKSLRRWKSKCEKPDSTYDNPKHKDWCDENNFGVTHFGIHPDKLPISTIRFDVFHLTCAITRKIMNYLRRFILKQSTDTVKEFSNTILRKFWSDFHVFCWNNKLNFSSFKGNELSLFIVNIPSVNEYLKHKFLATDELSDVVGGLSLMQDLFKFMSITYIDDQEIYKIQLIKFKKDLKGFYKFGKNTYLSDDETFYCHCFRYYLPQLVDITFERHKLGLGIFSMQGFERRNKESKNSLRRFSTMNRKSPYLLVNNMRRLLQVYLYEINAY